MIEVTMIRSFNIFPKFTVVCLVAASLLCAALPARAQYSLGNYGPGGGEGANAAPNLAVIKEKTNAQLPLDLPFTTSDGRSVKLGDLFDGKPVILSLVYFSCPKLCDLTQEGLVNGIADGPRNLKLGEDYNVIVVSIDPEESLKAAASKRKNYLARIDKPESQKGFTYLTGSDDATRTLAATVGFGYIRNKDSADKFSHSTGIFICTPSGKLSQTILGVSFEPDTLHFRLREAAGGRLGSGMLSVALTCGAMTYDPATGTYSHNKYFWAGTATGLLTLLALGTFLFVMWRGEYRKSHPSPTDTSDPSNPKLA